MNTGRPAIIETTAPPAETSRAASAPPIRPVVIAPTYNHAFALIDVLDRLEAIGLPIIVVNDGATDETAALLRKWESANRTVPFEIVTHARNRGKARALRTGFAAARIGGYTHAVTIDTDGQLMPEDIPRLLDVSRHSPDALVLGVRRDGLEGCPRSNRLAWWITALGVWLETGRRFLDNQCGLRVYPLQAFDVIRSRAQRYSFETEMVTRFVWAGCDVTEVPVTCFYPPADRRVSHFKLRRDAVLQFLFHAWLTLRRLLPWPHRKISAQRAPGVRRPAPPTWLEWISPNSLWRRLRHDRFEQLIVAAAAGIGTFMSAMPMNGWQIAIAVYASRRLHVHLLPTLLGVLLCATPIGSFQRDAAFSLGHLFFHLSLPAQTLLESARADHWATFFQHPISWLVGAVTIGFLSNWITIPTLVHVFKLIPVRREARPGDAAEGSSCI
jgi:glycosyltransferase involved in cell wall biosynthesis